MMGVYGNSYQNEMLNKIYIKKGSGLDKKRGLTMPLVDMISYNFKIQGSFGRFITVL